MRAQESQTHNHNENPLSDFMHTLVQCPPADESGLITVTIVNDNARQPEQNLRTISPRSSRGTFASPRHMITRWDESASEKQVPPERRSSRTESPPRHVSRWETSSKPSSNLQRPSRKRVPSAEKPKDRRSREEMDKILSKGSSPKPLPSSLRKLPY